MTAVQHRYLDAALERADPAALRAQQLRDLRRLLAKVWAENPFYRDRWRAAGATGPEIDSLEDFARRFPLVRKKDFMADQEESPPYGRRGGKALADRSPLLVMTTSGTSGQGVEIHLETHRERDATAKVSNFMYHWAGLERGDRMFLMFPVGMLGGGRIELGGLEAYGLTVFPVGSYDVKRKLELLQRFEPHAILSTTSYLGHLTAVGGEALRGWRPKALFGGGEGGGFSWFERLAAEWEAPVFNQYGATQTRVDPMFTCEHGLGTRERRGVLHNIDPYFLLEVIDPATGRQVEDGQSGEIVMTSLIHDEVPLIRCGMRDVAVYRAPRSCACGRSFSGVEVGSISRLDDMVKVKGINIWPQAVDDVLNLVPGMDEYQILVSSDETMSDVVTARVMPRPELAEGERDGMAAAIGQHLQDRIGIRFKVEMVPPGQFPRSEYKARRWMDARGRRD